MAEDTTNAPTGLSDEEKQQELNARTVEFNKELLPLLGKFELGLGASAFINPNGTIGARPVLFDARPQGEQEMAAPAASGETTPAPAAGDVTAA